MQPASAPLSEEQRKRRADYSHNLMRAFGSVMAIYARSPVHREMRLCDIETLVIPALTTGQFSLAEAAHKQNGLVTPVSVVLWASVSGAIDERITAAPEQPLAFGAADWKSGDIIWIVEAVGDQKAIGETMSRLQTNAWKGRTVKMRTQGEDGGIVAYVLQQAA